MNVNLHPSENEQPRRIRAFGLTWISYASYYLGRKNLSVTKVRIGEELHLSRDHLAAIDTVYLAAYAAGQFLNGWIGDSVGARRLLSFGMFASALACAAFGFARAFWLLFMAFLINGIAQSTGWPGNTKVMGAWTTPKNRGVVMGIWSTCYQVGGLTATALSTFLLSTLGWRSAFFGPAIWIALIAMLLWLALPERPSTKHHSDGVKESHAQDEMPIHSERSQVKQARIALLRSPILWCYGACYFSLKLIRYSLLFWLPYYLNKGLGYSEKASGYLSISFEIGGIVGTLLVGILSDRARFGSRASLSMFSLIGLAGALLLYTQIAGLGMIANFTGMALIGATLFGPDTLLSGAAAQDLGGKHAASTAAGFINGLGSLGAILQGIVTVQVEKRYGWNALFYAFLILTIASVLALMPVLRMQRPTQQE